MSCPITIQQGVPSCHSPLVLSSLIFSSSLQIYHFIPQVSPSVPITSLTLESRQPAILLLTIHPCNFHFHSICLLSAQVISFISPLQYQPLLTIHCSVVLCDTISHPPFLIQGDFQPWRIISPESRLQPLCLFPGATVSL